MKAPLPLAVLVLAGACQPAPVDRAREEVVEKTATQAPRSGATPSAPRGKAILDADGAAFGRTSANAERFAFGSSRAQVEAAADTVFGRADERSANGECGAGPMEFTRYGELVLNFQGGKLVGWLSEADPRVVTSDGIKAGLPFRDLQVVRSARLIEGSTLEGEFDFLAADGNTIGGFVTGSGRDAVVQSLYAGTNCFFR